MSAARSSCSPDRSASGWPATWTSGSRPGRTRSTPTCSCTSATPAPPGTSPRGGSASSSACPASASAWTASSTKPQTTGGDLRALCDLFGLSIAGAYRYTAVIDRDRLPRPRRAPGGLVTGPEIAMSTSVTAALVSGGAALVVALLGIAGAIAAQLVATRRAFENSLALFERQHARQEASRKQEREEEAHREDAYRFAEQRRSTYGRFVRLAREFVGAVDAERTVAKNLERIGRQRDRTRSSSADLEMSGRGSRAARSRCPGAKTAARRRIRRRVRGDLSAWLARSPAGG